MGMTLFAGLSTTAPSPDNVMMGAHAFCRVTGDPTPFPAPYLGHPCVVESIDPINHSLAPYLCRIQVVHLFARSRLLCQPKPSLEKVGN